MNRISQQVLRKGYIYSGLCLLEITLLIGWHFLYSPKINHLAADIICLMFVGKKKGTYGLKSHPRDLMIENRCHWKGTILLILIVFHRFCINTREPVKQQLACERSLKM